MSRKTIINKIVRNLEKDLQGCDRRDLIKLAVEYQRDKLTELDDRKLHEVYHMMAE